jgi:retron-type reverse transcriptase
MAEEKNNTLNEQMLCPIGRFFLKLEKASSRKSNVAKHLAQSQIELLKAVRYLIDEKIDDLEKTGEKREKKKSTRIKVE